MKSKASNEHFYRMYAKGLESLSFGDYQDVLKIAKKLHAANYSGAYELEARARYEMGDAQEATRILETGLRKFPTVYLLASYLGEFQSNQGHYQLAIEAFDKARNGEPDVDSYADLNIGISYARMEMWDRAAEYYAKVQFSPGYHGWLHYWVNKSRLEWRVQNYPQFLSDCEEGICVANRERDAERKKLAAWIYAYRAEFFAKEGKSASAKQDLQSAKALDPRNEQFLRAYRIVHGRLLPKANVYDVLLEGRVRGAPGFSREMGIFRWFEIIAESEAGLIPLAQLHAEPWETWTSINDIRSTSPVQDAREGVTWMAEAATLYGKYNWLDRLKSRLAGGQFRTLKD